MWDIIIIVITVKTDKSLPASVDVIIIKIFLLLNTWENIYS